MRLATRHGALIEEEEARITYLAEIETDSALAPPQSAACTYRIVLGPRAGQKPLTLKTVPAKKTPAPEQPQKGCVNANGFSLHAEVRCAMNQRNQLERLCRYITRPALAYEPLKLNAVGDIVL